MNDNNRRDFLKGLAVAGVAGMGLPLASAAETGAKVPLAKPVTLSLVDNQETRDGDRTETHSKFEMTGSNGAVHRIDSYQLRIERDHSYDVTLVMKIDKFTSASSTSPADSELRITLVSGDKGDIEGDHRNDEVQITTFGPEGHFKSPLQTVKKPIVDPYAGMSDQDKAQAIFNSRMRNPK